MKNSHSTLPTFVAFARPLSSDTLIKITEELEDECRLRQEFQSKASDLQANLETVKITSRSAIDTLQSQAQLSNTKKVLYAIMHQSHIRHSFIHIQYKSNFKLSNNIISVNFIYYHVIYIFLFSYKTLIYVAFFNKH